MTHVFTNQRIVDKKQNTLLHIACLKGRSVLVNSFLKSKDSSKSEPNVNLESLNQRKQTPLHLAAKAGHADIVKALLTCGASVRPDTDSYTPLHYVCSFFSSC